MQTQAYDKRAGTPERFVLTPKVEHLFTGQALFEGSTLMMTAQITTFAKEVQYLDKMNKQETRPCSTRTRLNPH